VQVLLLIPLLWSLFNSVNACEKSPGESFIVSKDVFISLNGSDYRFKTNKLLSLKVIGDGVGWGCRVVVLRQDGSKVNDDILTISELNLDSLKPKQNQGVDLVLRESVDEIVSGSNEVSSVGEVPCSGCDALNESLRPNLRPESFGGKGYVTNRSSGRTPIANLTISKKGLDYIKKIEGFAGNFYSDGERECTRLDASHICKTGQMINIPTIGHGEQIQNEAEFREFCREALKNNGCKSAKAEWLKVLKGRSSTKKIINQSTAHNLILDEVGDKIKAFKKDFPHIHLRQNEFDALISLYYNARQYFQPGFPSRFGEILSTPNFNLLDLVDEMYNIGPYAGNYKRRLDEINMLLLDRYKPITQQNDVKIPNDPRVRKLYKKMVRFWTAKRKRNFLRTNSEYRYFINKVNSL